MMDYPIPDWHRCHTHGSWKQYPDEPPHGCPECRRSEISGISEQGKMEAMSLRVQLVAMTERASKWKAKYEEGLHATSTYGARAEKAEAENEELQAGFDLRWKADMRAIEAWRAETGKALTSPDQADLCVWLLKRAEKAEAEHETTQKLLDIEVDSNRHLCEEELELSIEVAQQAETITRLRSAIDQLTVEAKDALHSWGMLGEDNKRLREAALQTEKEKS